MYAQLCKRLSEEAPNFEQGDGTISTFRKLLLNKCRVEFDNRAAALERHSYGAVDQDGTLLEEDELEERRQAAKRKMLGNIKFIGELGKLEILSENILHLCIRELLVRRGDDPSEDLECLCQIMRTCGRILDTDKGKYLMDQYFERMRTLADNGDLQPRIRFMLKDVIDLRNDNWMPRKAAIVEGPVPMAQIRPNEDDRLGFRRDRNQHDRDTDRSQTDGLFRHPLKTRGGLDDIFGFNPSPVAPLISAPPSFGSGPNGFGSGGGNGRDVPFRGDRRGVQGFGGAGTGGGGFENSRRGHYKHNQNNSGSNYNNQSNKDVAPRFKKNLIFPKENLGEVELRPSIVFNKASVKSNNAINAAGGGMQTNRGVNTALEPPHFGGSKQPPSAIKEPLPIAQDKPKQSKKDKGPNKEEVVKKFNTLLDDYWKGEVDIKQAINCYKEHKIPDKCVKDVIASGLSLALDKSDIEQEKLIKLLANLKEDGAVSGSAVQEACKCLFHALTEREVNGDREATFNAASILLADAVCEHLLPLSDVASLTDNGAHHPLFLFVLSRVKKKRGKSELSEIFNKSKVNLMAQLPESDKTKERLSEILEEYELAFLYPLLRIQADLARQLAADSNPQNFYKWIKENLESADFNDPGFINALVTVLIKYITQEAQSAGDEKAMVEKENSMLKRYQPILHAFLRDKSSLQLVALYSLQMHFYTLGFPRGQLLRWFVALYNLEIVDEEAFINWKEDVTDAYPGKGKALFQVNQWLTWLQEAESEEEEGED
ncbi:eukaryotic translation initiation factor 4 gamma 2 [Cylas formicarius]|uniref:eukaryotic translation initiation factor 4 gamma 2 n=1 Tax=Cylas formicarius TaxID=197179 RepID=UPI0029587636|nr:eukaryotic translation initiation factor 4 gamma 2 [Cylas formicarius]